MKSLKREIWDSERTVLVSSTWNSPIASTIHNLMPQGNPYVSIQAKHQIVNEVGLKIMAIMGDHIRSPIRHMCMTGFSGPDAKTVWVWDKTSSRVEHWRLPKPEDKTGLIWDQRARAGQWRPRKPKDEL